MRVVVCPYSEWVRHAGKSLQALLIFGGYIPNVAKARGVVPQTIVVENSYVDRDFLIDYSLYYARSFKPLKTRYTKRIHVFTERFDRTGFRRAFLSGASERYLRKLNDSYLGFVVVKPIPADDEGNNLLGRCLLKPYPENAREDPGVTRKIIQVPQVAHLGGWRFENFKAAPFIVQDANVMACATASLWVITELLRHQYALPLLSPCEITQKATAFVGEGRAFPAEEGLSLQQMLYYIRSIGMDTESLRVHSFKRDGANSWKRELKECEEDTVADFIRAFVSAGFPVIAELAMVGPRKRREEGGHAVVIVGFAERGGEVEEIYVHDDQFGPYTTVEPSNGSFLEWSCPWSCEFSKVLLIRLIAPIYQKVRMTFKRAYTLYKRWKENNIELGRAKLLLRTISDYRRELMVKLSSGYIIKEHEREIRKVLEYPQPRFLWVVRGMVEDGGRFYEKCDYLFDATASFISEYHCKPHRIQLPIAR